MVLRGMKYNNTKCHNYFRAVALFDACKHVMPLAENVRNWNV